MERLTCDNPKDNVSSALNLFYAKDGSVWVRGGGPGPEYKDISLDDYVRMMSKEHDLDIAQSDNDEKISCEMAELLFDGTDTVEGIIATLYTAGWAFAELRERLFAYEDTMPLERAQELAHAEKNERLVVLPDARHTDADGEKLCREAKEENPPLTLEQLRRMDGEPVYCASKAMPKDSAWGIVCIRDEVPYVRAIQNKGHIIHFFYLATYGSGWLAYRHKPKEGK